MRPRLTVLEIFYLLLGSGILGHEIIVTKNLTPTELGAAMFFFGLTAASVADREGTRGPIELIRALGDLITAARGGKGNP